MAPSDLPEDLVFHILIQLPVRSLLRFKSVCKSWRSLITSSTFITHHLNHHSNNSRGGHNLLLNTYHPEAPETQLYILSGNKFQVFTKLDFDNLWFPVSELASSSSSSSSSDCYSITRVHVHAHGDTLTSLFNPSMSELHFRGSYNGLVCLYNRGSGDIALWNPATTQLKPLPETSLPTRPSISQNSHGQNCYSPDSYPAFYFDVNTNDYIVVILSLTTSNNPKNSQVQVYSLNSDSWRIVHTEAAFPRHCSLTH